MAGEAIRFNASLNTAGFDSGAKSLQNIASRASSGISAHFGKIAMAVAGIGAAFLGIRAAVQSFNAAIAMGGQLNDLAARTGETAGNLAVLQRAFQNAGAGAEAVGPTINRLQRAIIEAGEGGAQQAKAFEKLGLDLEDIKRKTPTEQLQAVAAALNGVGNDSERGAIAMQLLGRSGGELLPLLRAMGGELDNARQQLGSLPDVIDRTNAHLDKIGDNFKAIGEKGKEFMVGLLEQLAPGLADLTDKIAQIDAAGLGSILSEYAKRTADWISETFRLGTALEQVRVAIEGITSGNFAQGFSLLFSVARDTAFNAINQIVAAATAGLETVSSALVKIFNKDSTTMAFIRGSFSMLGGMLAEGIFNSLASVLEKIPFMGAASKAVRAAAEEAKQGVQDISNIMHHEAGNLVKEWADVGAAMGNEFLANYDSNIQTPLIDMRNRTAETADQAERLEQATRAAAFNAETFAEAMSNARLDRFAPAPGAGPGPLAPSDKKFPWQGSGPSGSQQPAPTNAGGGGGTRGGGAPNPRQQSTIEMLRQRAGAGDLDAMTEMGRMQNENSRFMDRANRLRDSGNFRSAAQAELAGNRASERRADNAAMRDRLQQEFGTKDSGTALREFRDNFGMDSSRLISEGLEKLGLKFDKTQSEQKNFERLAIEQAKMADSLSKTEDERERKKDDATTNASGGGGTTVSDLATESTLMRIFEKIQERPILVA